MGDSISRNQHEMDDPDVSPSFDVSMWCSPKSEVLVEEIPRPLVET